MSATSALVVVKIGGALLGDAGALAQACGAVASRRLRGERLLVVVSALKGVTDALERATRLALDPRSGHELVRDVMESLHAQHGATAAGLPDRDAVLLRLAPVFDSVERLLTGIRLTGELTPRTRDLVMAHGERLAAPLVAAGVLAAGADARAVTSEEAGLVATGGFRVGSCDVPASSPGLLGLAHELHDRALILTGFYGLNADSEVVLFGRGGSDYTAGVVAAALSADGLELWKDVPGFMTADPRAVPGARLVPELSYDEACELGLYGAKILHPRCLDPIRGLPVDVSVRPVADVDRVGTHLQERRTRKGGEVVALAARRDVAVVRVQDASMINEPGVAGRILARMGTAGINVDAVASSMTSLSFSIDQENAALARRTLKLLAQEGAPDPVAVEINEHCALLGVVGDGVAGDAKIGGRMLSCLGDLGIQVDLVSHGPGDVGLSCALSESQLQPAMEALHATFFAGRASRPSRHARSKTQESHP
ncbi:MAG: aspartate kinase [Planctomycetota bacterium]